MNTTDNPLLKKSALPHGALPFGDIKEEHFLPALEEAIRLAKERIHAIEESSEEPHFKNTVEALETSSEEVEMVGSVFFNLLNAHSNDEMQALAKEISPKLSRFSNEDRI